MTAFLKKHYRFCVQLTSASATGTCIPTGFLLKRNISEITHGKKQLEFLQDLYKRFRYIFFSLAVVFTL